MVSLVHSSRSRQKEPLCEIGSPPCTVPLLPGVITKVSRGGHLFLTSWTCASRQLVARQVTERPWIRLRGQPFVVVMQSANIGKLDHPTLFWRMHDPRI